MFHTFGAHVEPATGFPPATGTGSAAHALRIRPAIADEEVPCNSRARRSAGWDGEYQLPISCKVNSCQTTPEKRMNQVGTFF